MIEDKIVYSDNYENPLEEIYNAEIFVASSVSYTKYKPVRQIDISICPNLTTTYPVMKVGVYKTLKDYNNLENKAFIKTESRKTQRVVFAYLSLVEARYVSAINIKNEKLYSNYILNEAELGMLIGALNAPSSYDSSNNSWEEAIKRINNFFSNTVVEETKGNEDLFLISSFQKNIEVFAHTYNVSESRLAKPIYKEAKITKMPNYHRLIKNSN